MSCPDVYLFISEDFPLQGIERILCADLSKAFGGAGFERPDGFVPGLVGGVNVRYLDPEHERWKHESVPFVPKLVLRIGCPYSWTEVRFILVLKLVGELLDEHKRGQFFVSDDTGGVVFHIGEKSAVFAPGMERWLKEWPGGQPWMFDTLDISFAKLT